MFFKIVFLCISIATFLLINSKVEYPVIDEQFHHAQTQKYCNYKWSEWDPKITTPPGLYLASLLPSLLLGCNLYVMRMVNLLFSIGTFHVSTHISHLSSCLRYNGSSGITTKGKCDNCEWSAFNMASFPLLFFYSMLYYTDTSSTFLVLLSLLLSLKHQYLSSALIALLSLLFRQTNIIWAFYIASSSLLRTYSSFGKIRTNPWPLLKISICYGPIAFLFLLFMWWNNWSIVLGDKSNHVVSLHFPQLFYLSCFLIFFTIPHVIFSVNMQKSARYLFRSILLLPLSFYLVSKFTIHHPFLLSDNRHYSFYIWNRIYRRTEYVKYQIIPIYHTSLSILLSLQSTRSTLETILFWLCCALSLVPSPLLEFRYFILPFIIYRSLCVCSYTGKIPKALLMCESLFFSAVNFVTIWMFLYRGFKWEGTPEIQRFMY